MVDYQDEKDCGDYSAEAAASYPRLRLGFKSSWLEALRGGRFFQGVGELYQPGYEDDVDQVLVPAKFCCLGVGCRVLGVEPVGKDGSTTSHDPDWPWAAVYQPPAFGRPEISHIDLQAQLANMNDRGTKFLDIADWIEENL